MKVAEKLLQENHTGIYQTQHVKFVRNSVDQNLASVPQNRPTNKQAPC